MPGEGGRSSRSSWKEGMGVVKEPRGSLEKGGHGEGGIGGSDGDRQAWDPLQSLQDFSGGGLRGLFGFDNRLGMWLTCLGELVV